MGNKINLVEEIYQRLLNSIAENKPLYGVKRVRIGRVEEARKGNDFPVINIMPMSGIEDPNFPNRHVRDNIRIGVALIINKLSDQSNSLYTVDGSGALGVLENILDVLDKNVSGVVDNTLSGTCESIVQYEWRLDETDEQAVIDIIISTKTKTVPLGGRSDG